MKAHYSIDLESDNEMTLKYAVHLITWTLSRIKNFPEKGAVSQGKVKVDSDYQLEGVEK